jgi:hypothetical protein
MHLVEITGYLASALVFATFYVKAMAPLRLIAIASNIAFIGYGYQGQLAPIVLLHAGLLPLNMWRLWQARHLSAHRRGTAGGSLCARFLRVRRLPRRRPERGAAADRQCRPLRSGRPSGAPLMAGTLQGPNGERNGLSEPTPPPGAPRERCRQACR